MLAKGVNGRIIEPGEVFSFNDEVGFVTAEQGYKEVLLYKTGSLFPVSARYRQVATTLWVALLGEMEIVQRSFHSRPVSYVPLGQDATVAQGLIVLSFVIIAIIPFF